ncbi:MAG: hypothetical protein HYZ37_08055, partial [Candidatus Solibacter usitatus]|nr:hypothetical protein [Candidatus Solibacter usitatus]
MAESDPQAMVTLFGGLNQEEILILEPLQRELNLSVKAMDHVYLVATAKAKWIEHYEAELYGHNLRDRLPDYSMGSCLKYKLPIRCTVVWMSKRAAPKTFPTQIDVDFWALQVTLHVRHVKVWELPAAELLRSDRPSLWPWVGAATGTEADVFAAGMRIHN